MLTMWDSHASKPHNMMMTMVVTTTPTMMSPSMTGEDCWAVLGRGGSITLSDAFVAGSREVGHFNEDNFLNN